MNVACFYHVFADGDWQGPLAEHLQALDRGGFDGLCVAGVVGTRERQHRVCEVLGASGRAWKPHGFAKGFEQLTLRLVSEYARGRDDAVLYMHSKGAYRPSRLQDAWRRSMTAALLGDLQGNLGLLDGVDAVGSHWVAPGSCPAAPWPHFAGNFWLARCDYLRTLPECPRVSRHDAEAWLGRNNPKVHDLWPGWPGTVPFFQKRGWPR